MKTKEQKMINTNVIARHNAIVLSRDQQSWRPNMFKQTCLNFFEKNLLRNNLKSN